MNDPSLNHVSIQCKDKEKADIFFNRILKIPKIKEFVLSEDLSKKIFDIPEKVTIFVYENKHLKFEVFISNKKQVFSFNHICIQVDNKKKLIDDCNKYNLEINLVNKNKKNLLFIKDFSKNIYEIK